MASPHWISMQIEIGRRNRTLSIEEVLDLYLIEHISQYQDVNIDGRWLARHKTAVNKDYHIRCTSSQLDESGHGILERLIERLPFDGRGREGGDNLGNARV